MANYIYGAVDLTGGATGSLDSIDGTDLAQGDSCIVFTGTYTYIYSLNETSAETENSPLIISPDSNAGDKRWKLLAMRASEVNLDVASFNKILSSSHTNLQLALNAIDDMHSATDFEVASGSVALKGTVVKSVSAGTGSATPATNAFTIAGANRIRTSGSGAIITITDSLVPSTKTGAYTILAADNFIIGDTSGGSFALTLPAANAKDIIRLAKKSNSNTLTITAAGTDTIEGSASIALTAEYTTVVLVSNGVNIWYEM